MVAALNITATATPDLRTTQRDIAAVGAFDPSTVRGRADAAQGSPDRLIPVDPANGKAGSGYQDQSGQAGSQTGSGGTGSGQLSSFLGQLLGQLISVQEADSTTPPSAAIKVSAAYQAATSRTDDGSSETPGDLQFPDMPVLASGRRVDLTV
jgi:hypothetical protein